MLRGNPYDPRATYYSLVLGRNTRIDHQNIVVINRLNHHQALLLVNSWSMSRKSALVRDQFNRIFAYRQNQSHASSTNKFCNFPIKIQAQRKSRRLRGHMLTIDKLKVNVPLELHMVVVSNNMVTSSPQELSCTFKQSNIWPYTFYVKRPHSRYDSDRFSTSDMYRPDTSCIAHSTEVPPGYFDRTRCASSSDYIVSVFGKSAGSSSLSMLSYSPWLDFWNLRFYSFLVSSMWSCRLNPSESSVCSLWEPLRAHILISLEK